MKWKMNVQNVYKSAHEKKNGLTIILFKGVMVYFRFSEIPDQDGLSKVFFFTLDLRSLGRFLNETHNLLTLGWKKRKYVSKHLGNMPS